MSRPEHLSCADCNVTACDSHSAGPYPAFCPTPDLDPARKQEALTICQEPETLRVMQEAARVEHDGYCVWPRVQELISFANGMGYRHLGIATCVGLLRESRTLTSLLRSHGFQVTAVGCKVGAIPKEDFGINPACNEVGLNACNPVLQAALLTEAGTELNIVMGLCVGHDALFSRHSTALVTTLVTKDRVLGHNPVAALYTANSYYKHLKGSSR